MSGVRPGNGWYGIRSGTGTGVGSLETAERGWQRFNIAKTSAAVNDSVTHGIGFVAGDYTILNAPTTRRRLVTLSVVRKLTNVSGVVACNINFSLTVNGVSKTMVASASTNSTVTKYPNGYDRTLEYRTPPLEIPAGGTVSGGSISVGLRFGGAGFADDGIEQVQLLDVSRIYDGV
jgi:hypothetical protein